MSSMKIFSGASGIWYVSKTCLNRSESSIAPTTERFAVVFVQILTNSQNGCPHEEFFSINLFKGSDFIKLVQKIQVKCHFWLQKVVEMCKVYSKTSSITLQVISIEYFKNQFKKFSHGNSADLKEYVSARLLFGTILAQKTKI